MILQDKYDNENAEVLVKTLELITSLLMSDTEHIERDGLTIDRKDLVREATSIMPPVYNVVIRWKGEVVYDSKTSEFQGGDDWSHALTRMMLDHHKGSDEATSEGMAEELIRLIHKVTEDKPLFWGEPVYLTELLREGCRPAHDLGVGLSRSIVHIMEQPDDEGWSGDTWTEGDFQVQLLGHKYDPEAGREMPYGQLFWRGRMVFNQPDGEYTFGEWLKEWFDTLQETPFNGNEEQAYYDIVTCGKLVQMWTQGMTLDLKGNAVPRTGWKLGPGGKPEKIENYQYSANEGATDGFDILQMLKTLERQGRVESKSEPTFHQNSIERIMLSMNKSQEIAEAIAQQSLERLTTDFLRRSCAVFWSSVMEEAATAGIRDVTGITCRFNNQVLPPMFWNYEKDVLIVDDKQTHFALVGVCVYQIDKEIYFGLVLVPASSDHQTTILWDSICDGDRLDSQNQVRFYTLWKFLTLPIVKQIVPALDPEERKRRKKRGMPVPSLKRIVEFVNPSTYYCPPGSKHVTKVSDLSAEPSSKRKGYSCCFMVRGFWRRQWYPSTRTHELLWIESFVKGDRAKPLKISKRAYKVTREHKEQTND